MFTRVNNLKIHYRQAGQAGRLLLILHGWGKGIRSWQKFLDLVKKKTEARQGAPHQIIIPDLPGFGQSDAPPNAWSVVDYAQFVWQFLEKLKIKEFDLLCHSFGGRIAIKIAAELSPNHTTHRVVSINNNDQRNNGLSLRINHLFLCAAAGLKHPPTFRQKSVELAVKAYHLLPLTKGETQRGLIWFLRKILYKLVGAGDYNQAKGIMKEVFKKVIAEDLTTQLSKIKIPTTIIWGDQDKLTPLSDGRLMQAKIAGSELIVLKGVGHNVQQEAGEELYNKISNYSNFYIKTKNQKPNTKTTD